MCVLVAINLDAVSNQTTPFFPAWPVIKVLTYQSYLLERMSLRSKLLIIKRFFFFILIVLC